MLSCLLSMVMLHQAVKEVGVVYSVVFFLCCLKKEVEIVHVTIDIFMTSVHPTNNYHGYELGLAEQLSHPTPFYLLLMIRNYVCLYITGTKYTFYVRRANVKISWNVRTYANTEKKDLKRAKRNNHHSRTAQICRLGNHKHRTLLTAFL